MCFPQVEGGIEVEERRPKYRGEPRRKRLNFVRDRSSHRLSDEWVLTRGSYQHRNGRREMWEEPAPWRQPPHDPGPQPHGWSQQATMPIIPVPPMHPMHPHPVEFHGHQGHQGHHGMNGRDDPRIVPLNAGHAHDNHSHHGGYDDHCIKVIEDEPKAKMPKYIKYKKTGSSRPHSRRRQARSVYSSDSDEDSFTNNLPRRIGRAWSESTGSSDDSFKDYRRPRRVIVRKIY